MVERSRACIALAVILAITVAGCGSSGNAAAPSAKLRRAGGGIPRSLLAEERPIGAGARYHPAVSGKVLGDCRAPLGKREQVHIEIFGNNLVVLLGAGIGVEGRRHSVDGRIVSAACFGVLVTLDRTGTVYVRPHSTLTIGDLFRSWGQTLTSTQIASFTGGQVKVYVQGRRRNGPAAQTPLTPGKDIVLEIGPRVPPHHRFVFEPAPSASTP